MLLDSISSSIEYLHVPYVGEEIEMPAVKLKFNKHEVMTELTREALGLCGLKETKDQKQAVLVWGKQFDITEYSSFGPWQKVNHFAGAYLIGRKDNFHKYMMSFKKKEPELGKFYPSSYLLPDQAEDLSKIWKKHKLWIKKPSASSRGRGIKVISSENKPPKKSGLVQVYIEKPFLITGRKFDIRMYILIPSVNPLKIYVHSNGMARFCSQKYKMDDPTDLHSHLTNFSINKNDSNFIRCSGEESVEDSKWTLQFFHKYLKENGYDADKIFDSLYQTATKTFLIGMTAVRDKHIRYVYHRNVSSELYGIDIILDENLNPHVMEVNISPSMKGSDSKLDHDLKLPVMLDTLRLFKIYQTSSDVVTEFEKAVRQSVSNERLNSVMKGQDPWEKPVISDIQTVKEFLYEQANAGGYRLMYPTKETVEEYKSCLENMHYNDIVLLNWVKMNDERKEKVLAANIKKYKKFLSQFQK
ncbi:Tubulin-tyrosine ligase family protein [Trichomonas vaginalis G3]|uniref:Tubulin--tyrosine ligase-like protein 5 n=1 Tax=Trichomonas vaginalis (strain ATCC PRA-98 / G3) TaxID=412133 RepID=A2E616_TRIV3|nr:protein polyglutamylation [Trichomonas vaginalis G3]EAY11858.1 Tubulin-tyrosine ligase family protein [Trichomonas vaginalis G3]KAI5532268.1 protein polyglutamylation [Trichomonas vaginalis G3]|eukprot:XP_001324081.1 Tubulin-tyrosine ligase family protein [Trichomonas vaginalis G3]